MMKKINFDKTATWAIMSIIGFTTLFIAWLCGGKMNTLSILVLFAGTIISNLTVVVIDRHKDCLKTEIDELKKKFII